MANKFIFYPPGALELEWIYSGKAAAVAKDGESPGRTEIFPV